MDERNCAIEQLTRHSNLVTAPIHHHTLVRASGGDAADKREANQGHARQAPPR